MTDSLPTIVVVGAGFGGLQVARDLRRAAARVVLIDRRGYHLFQPLLYQVATAGLGPDQIAYPARAILRGQQNLDFCMTEVRQVNLVNKTLETGFGEVRYDYLVLAIGGTPNYFGLQSVAQHAFTLKDLSSAVNLRNRILGAFERAVQEPDAERRRAALTFVVAGGGPTGVEMAGALAELIRLVLTKDYPRLNFKDVRILLLEASDRLLSGMPPKLQEAAAETLWHKHVEVRFGAAVADYDGDRVLLKGGEVIPACTLIWAAGVRAAGLADRLGMQQARQGRVPVERTLQVAGHPEVFVVGDAAYLEDGMGQPPPMVAPVAIQQGRVAARNILRALAGQAPEEFVYSDPGTLATIGRNAAVARVGRWQAHGFFAWLLWLGVHIFWLVGFRNRLLVMINWAWDYFFYDRGARLITSE